MEPKKKNLKSSRPTIKDIAIKANVSPTIVSLVLRHRNTSRASSETQNKIFSIAQQLGYRPNYIARSLVRNETKTIGLVVPIMFNYFYADFANDIIERANEKGYGVLARGVQNDPQDERRVFNDLLDRGVDGLIVCSALRQDPVVMELAGKDRPFVLVMRDVEFHRGDRPIDFVGLNNHLSGYMAVQHLIKDGYSRIGLIMGLQTVSTGYDRYVGALEALRDYGIKHDPKLTCFGEFHRGTGYHLMLHILKKPKLPDAVFAASDSIAVGVMEALRSKGIRVPQDMALIGVDDTALASIPGFDLTAVSQKKSIMGRLGVDYLVAKIAEKKKEVVERTILKPILVIRRSCGCGLSQLDSLGRPFNGFNN